MKKKAKKAEPKTLPTPADLVVQIVSLREQGGNAYAASDKLVGKLRRMVPKGALVHAPTGIYKLVNHFKGKDRAVAVGFARRWTLEKASREDLKELEKAVPAAEVPA